MRSSKTCQKYVCFAIWEHKDRIITPLKLKSVPRDNMKIKRDFSRSESIWKKNICFGFVKEQRMFQAKYLIKFSQNTIETEFG